jgi:hypothetical protein
LTRRQFDLTVFVSQHVVSEVQAKKASSGVRSAAKL